MKCRILYLSFAFSLLTSMVCTAEVYRWVDEHGKTHFSDKPIGKNSESITIKQQPKLGNGAPTTKTPASSPDLQQKLLDAYSDRRKLKEQEQKKQEHEKQQVEAHKKKCAKAKDYLARTEGSRIFDVDQNGERIYRSDTEIDASRAVIQSDINKYCN